MISLVARLPFRFPCEEFVPDGGLRHSQGEGFRVTARKYLLVIKSANMIQYQFIIFCDQWLGLIEDKPIFTLEV